jgi:hypothetical protein
MNGKQKRVVVSLQIKLDAIKRMDQGETIKKVASDLGHHTCRSFVAEVPTEHSSKEARNCN